MGARVLIADDHELVLRGLRAVLESAGHEVCGTAKTGREAVAMARRLAPQIVVLDVSMPELNGLDAARQIKRAQPTTEILILTVHESDRMIRDVLEAGARGYLLKSDLADELAHAIEALRRHQPYFSSRVAEVVLSGFLAQSAAAPEDDTTEPSRLTPREREIVQLISEGLSTKQVARRLAISVKTVETHRANVQRKLGVASVGEIVRYAIRNGIVEA